MSYMKQTLPDLSEMAQDDWTDDDSDWLAYAADIEAMAAEEEERRLATADLRLDAERDMELLCQVGAL